MRISILSNVNLDMLSGLLKKDNEIFQPEGYGRWITYALQGDMRLDEFAPECLFLLLEGNTIIKNRQKGSTVAEELDRVETYVSQLAQRYSTSFLLVSSMDVCPEQIRGKDSRDISLVAMNEWEIRLTRLTEEHKNIHRFELAALIADYGRKQFYSEKFWYMGSIPYDMKALHALAEAMGKVLSGLKRTRKKVLVLDLDNTLWGGVVGEDGAMGICLDETHEGAIYRDAQLEIKKMQQMGVVLAIVSKNNIEDVESVFADNPHMVLKKEDFASIYANWKPKSENIRLLAEELNLGLDSFVFVDDNEVERKEVEQSIPQITVAEFPADITQLANTMKEIYNRYFESWVITQEDREKTKQYQQEHLRKEEQKAAVSFEEYLKSLETVIRLREVDEETKERAVQLMNKTNQFNVCTLRMNELELEQYLKDGGHLLIAEVADKHGNSGWVAEFLYHMEENRAVADNFLMSCRVMGRKIEHAIFGAVMEKLQSQGIGEIKATYCRTPKNKPVEHLWSELGFCETNENQDETDVTHYSMVMTETADNREEKVHTVIWEGLKQS